ncbi:hypothetical protein FQV27_13890 [Paracoccus aurantiacus]|uniref:Dihydrodipicolinate reductase n=2 Tax=Paracoccus aurantiacus TaxID=2599412 RepID=A0A5C6S246_9RHOB|nr:hypothetical protein FQV27_13890 [Paracoccus aurantiacus]
MQRMTVAIVCVVSGLMAHGVAAEPIMIVNEQQFRDAVVGRTLMLGENEITANAGGQITGTLNGEPITASKWVWGRDKFCRAVRTASQDFPSECQGVSLDGDKVIFDGGTTWTIR